MLTLAFDCTNEHIVTIIKYLKSLLQVLQILVPILLILMGSIDLGKSVMASDEGAMKKSQKKFFNRCIAAVMVFLAATVVKFAMDFVGNNAWEECWNKTTKDTASEGEGVTPDGTTHSTSGGEF